MLKTENRKNKNEEERRRRTQRLERKLLCYHVDEMDQLMEGAHREEELNISEKCKEVFFIDNPFLTFNPNTRYLYIDKIHR